MIYLKTGEVYQDWNNGQRKSAETWGMVNSPKKGIMNRNFRAFFVYSLGLKA